MDKYSTDGAAAAVNVVVGMAFAEAVEKIDALKAQYRIVKVDGVPRITTRDYVNNRVNIELTNGVVTLARIG